MKIAFLASPKHEAQTITQTLVDMYGQSDIAGADCIVAIGGDGTVLKALNAGMGGKPVFAMRSSGSVGFLANRLQLADLPQRLREARNIMVHPLRAKTDLADGSAATVHALNEVVLIRQQLQAAKLLVTIEGTGPSANFIGDGLIVATPLGSTGYNLSAGGAALEHASSSVTLTGLAVHRQSDWFNRVVSNSSVIDIEVLAPEHRPVRLETSETILTGVRRVRIDYVRDMTATLLLDPG